MASVSVHKAGTGLDVCVAVQLPRKTVATRGKTSRTAIHLSEDLDETAFGVATKRMKVANLCRGPEDAVFEEVGGAVFRSGASSSCSVNHEPLAFPTREKADSVPLSLAVQQTDLPWSKDNPADKPLVNMLLQEQTTQAPTGGSGSSIVAVARPLVWQSASRVEESTATIFAVRDCQRAAPTRVGVGPDRRRRRRPRSILIFRQTNGRAGPKRRTGVAHRFSEPLVFFPQVVRVVS